MKKHSVVLCAVCFVVSAGASIDAAASGITGFYTGPREGGAPPVSYLVFNPSNLGALDQPRMENAAATQLLEILKAAGAPSPAAGVYVLGNITAKLREFPSGGAESDGMASASIGIANAADLRSLFSENAAISVSFRGEPARELSSLMNKANWRSNCDTLGPRWACCPMGAEKKTVCHFFAQK